MPADRGWLRVGRSDEVGTTLVRRTLLGRHVGFYRDEGGVVHAIEVTCRHQLADLTLGERRGTLVTCPRHGWVYDLATGACLTEPWARLRRYAVREEEGAVWVGAPLLADGAGLARGDEGADRHPGGRSPMRASELFALQLEREAAISRRVLDRAPAGRPEWKPHPRSMPLGYLAQLVATMPSWVAMAVQQDELDLAPPGGGGPAPQTWNDTSELLAMHDAAVARARAALQATDDDFLLTPWRLLVGGKTVMESPRHVVIADTFCHLAHHRGQLTVYLRLNEVALPSVYGPTADEPGFG